VDAVSRRVRCRVLSSDEANSESESTSLNISSGDDSRLASNETRCS
jgi:hypothetical protein